MTTKAHINHNSIICELSGLNRRYSIFFLFIAVNSIFNDFARALPQQEPHPQIMFEHSEPVQENHKCREWEWLCADQVECIAQYDVCDGVAQCSDGSDEKNCLNRFPAESYQRHQPQPSMKNPPIPSPTDTKPTHHQTNDEAETNLNMKYVFGGLSIFVFVAFIVHALLKRRKRRLGDGARGGFRKGESLIEDEDDLLISQMYT